MTSIYARNTVAGARAAWIRVACAVALLASAVGMWRLLQPLVLYRLACFNLGNFPEGDSLADQAVRVRYPRWPNPPRAPGPWAYFGSRTRTSHTGRTATAIVQTRVLRHPQPPHDGALWNEWQILDDRLNLVAMVRGTYLGLGTAADDRDGDGTLELIHRSADFIRQLDHGGSAPDVEYVTFTVVSLGNTRHSVVAAIDLPIRKTDDWPDAEWTNAEGDSLHELEWLQWTPPTPSATAPATPLRATYVSILKLRWLRPGVMTCDAPPPGVRFWFSKEKDQATFSPEESIDDVARRLLGEPPGPPTDAPEPRGNPVGR